MTPPCRERSIILPNAPEIIMLYAYCVAISFSRYIKMYMQPSINTVKKSKIIGPFFIPENMPKLTPVFSTHTILKNGKTAISFEGIQTFCIICFLERKSAKNPSDGIKANRIAFRSFIYRQLFYVISDNKKLENQ